MKKFLFIAALVAMIVGTSVDTSAKVKRGKGKRKAQTTKNIYPPKTMKSHHNTMVIEDGMWTVEGAERLANGDVANLEMAYLIGFYKDYVFNGNIYDKAQFRYLKLKFTKHALEMLDNGDGTFKWDIITGNGKINRHNFRIKELRPKEFIVEGGGHKCIFEVVGIEGSYKIARVHPPHLMEREVPKRELIEVEAPKR